MDVANRELAIQLYKLSICYDGQWVLKNFSLEVFPNDKVVLTGPSGSGKSTVLRCILGLAVPDSGAVAVLGEAITSYNIWKTRQYIAYVAQEPDLGSGSVREVIEKPFTYRANCKLRNNLEHLPALMERFNLPPSILHKQIANISGGEKQRIALTISILLDRSIVLLDEASSALDKDNKQAVADYFNQAENITVLSVAHDTEWLEFATRVVDMQEHNSIMREEK